MAYTTIKYCPYCHKTINLRFEIKKSGYMIGETEIYRCSHCEKLITNGLKEWPEMSKVEKAFEKFIFFLDCCGKGILWTVVSGLIFFLLWGIWGTISGDWTLWPVVLFGGCGFIVGVLMGGLRSKCVIGDSIERYNQQQKKTG